MSNPAALRVDEGLGGGGGYGTGRGMNGDEDDRSSERYTPTYIAAYDNLGFHSAPAPAPGLRPTNFDPATTGEEEDDPCDAGPERDPMDDAEIDRDDEARQFEYECCGEARYNCGLFTSVLAEQGRELKGEFGKIDFKKKARGCFSVAKLKDLFPIINWLPKYRATELQGDLIAGLTVGMTLIPQAIAYAGIANIAPQYGLYSSFIGCFIYVIFGTSKDIALGPTAIMSLLTATYGKALVAGDPTCAIVLGLFTGIVQIGMYLLGLGAIINFMSFPVMKAFTVACSITIGMSQVKKWFGQKGVPREFIPQLVWTIRKIPESRLYDFLLGVVCIFFIVLLKKLKEMKWEKKFRDLPLSLKIAKKTLWFIGTARNIVVLVIASVVAFIFLENGIRPFTLTGYIPPGIPPFAAPAFSIFDAKKNVTYEFTDIMSSIGGGIIVLPLLGLIESMSIAKVFARKYNYKLDVNQELLPYGISNVLGAFVMGYGVAGAFSRTAVNAGSGVKTPAGGIITGLLVLLALQFLTPLFYYIPEAALAVVIIMAIIDPITFHKLWIFWKTRKIDLIPWIITFILSFVLSIEFGIAVGVGISLLLLLYPVVHPTIRVQDEYSNTNGEKVKLIVITLNNGLMYPAVEYIKEKIFVYCTGVNIISKDVILDFAHVSTVDTTAIQGVRELLEDLNKLGIRVIIVNLQKPVALIFARSKPKYFNSAASVQEAVEKITIITTNDRGCNGGSSSLTSLRSVDETKMEKLAIAFIPPSLTNGESVPHVTSHVTAGQLMPSNSTPSPKFSRF